MAIGNEQVLASVEQRQPLLQLDRQCKSFGAMRANEDVSICI